MELTFKSVFFAADSDSYSGSYFQWGGGRRTTLGDWTWHQGAIAGCSGRGAIAGSYRRVPLSCGMVGGEGDDQLWRSGRGAVAGCHCRVSLEGRVRTNFGGVHVVPLQGAIVVCYGSGGGRPTLREWTWCCAMVGGEGDDQLWGSARGAFAGCHCSVLWLGER